MEKKDVWDNSFRYAMTMAYVEKAGSATTNGVHLGIGDASVSGTRYRLDRARKRGLLECTGSVGKLIWCMTPLGVEYLKMVRKVFKSEIGVSTRADMVGSERRRMGNEMKIHRDLETLSLSKAAKQLKISITRLSDIERASGRAPTSREIDAIREWLV